MAENGEQALPAFNNIELKNWLRGNEGRRRRLLVKLKNDLRKLGLSKQATRRGLIQLAVKPSVVLRRLPDSCCGSSVPCSVGGKRRDWTSRYPHPFYGEIPRGTREIIRNRIFANAIMEPRAGRYVDDRKSLAGMSRTKLDGDAEEKERTEPLKRSVASEHSSASRKKLLQSSHDSNQTFIPSYFCKEKTESKHRDDPETKRQTESSQNIPQQSDIQIPSGAVGTVPSISASKTYQNKFQKNSLSRAESCIQYSHTQNSVREATKKDSHIDSNTTSTNRRDISVETSNIKATPGPSSSKDKSLSKHVYKSAHKSSHAEKSRISSSKNDAIFAIFARRFEKRKKIETEVKQASSSVKTKLTDTLVQECSYESKKDKISSESNISSSSNTIISEPNTCSKAKVNDTVDEAQDASISDKYTQVSHVDSELSTEQVGTLLDQTLVKKDANQTEINFESDNSRTDGLSVKRILKAVGKRRMSPENLDQNMLPTKIRKQNDASTSSDKKVINSNTETFDNEIFSEDEQAHVQQIPKNITKRMIRERENYKLLRQKKELGRKDRDKKVKKIREKFHSFFRDSFDPDTSESEEEREILLNCLQRRKQQRDNLFCDVTTDEEMEDTFKRHKKSTRDTSANNLQRHIESIVKSDDSCDSTERTKKDHDIYNATTDEEIEDGTTCKRDMLINNSHENIDSVISANVKSDNPLDSIACIEKYCPIYEDITYEEAEDGASICKRSTTNNSQENEESTISAKLKFDNSCDNTASTEHYYPTRDAAIAEEIEDGVSTYKRGTSSNNSQENESVIPSEIQSDNACDSTAFTEKYYSMNDTAITEETEDGVSICTRDTLVNNTQQNEESAVPGKTKVNNSSDTTEKYYSMHDATTAEDMEDGASICNRGTSTNNLENTDNTVSAKEQCIENSLTVDAGNSIKNNACAEHSESTTPATIEMDVERMKEDRHLNQDVEKKVDTIHTKVEEVNAQTVLQNRQKDREMRDIETVDLMTEDIETQKDTNLELPTKHESTSCNVGEKNGCDVLQNVENDSIADDEQTVTVDQVLVTSSKSERISLENRCDETVRIINTPSNESNSNDNRLSDGHRGDDDNNSDIEVEIKIKPKLKSRISRKFSLKAPWSAVNTCIKNLNTLKDNPGFLNELFQMNDETSSEKFKHRTTTRSPEDNTSINVNKNVTAECIETVSNTQENIRYSSPTTKDNVNCFQQQQKSQDYLILDEKENTMDSNQGEKDKCTQSVEQKTQITAENSPGSSKLACDTSDLGKQLPKTSMTDKQKINEEQEKFHNNTTLEKDRNAPEHNQCMTDKQKINEEQEKSHNNTTLEKDRNAAEHNQCMTDKQKINEEQEKSHNNTTLEKDRNAAEHNQCMTDKQKINEEQEKSHNNTTLEKDRNAAEHNQCIPSIERKKTQVATENSPGSAKAAYDIGIAEAVSDIREQLPKTSSDEMRGKVRVRSIAELNCRLHTIESMNHNALAISDNVCSTSSQSTLPQSASPQSTPPQSALPQSTPLQSVSPQSVPPLASFQSASQLASPQSALSQSALSQSALSQSALLQSTPSQLASPQSAPRQSAPFQSPPLLVPFQSTSPQSAPFHSAPVQSTPLQSASPQSASFQSAPFQSASPQSVPFQSAPPQLAPPQSASSQSVPKRPLYNTATDKHAYPSSRANAPYEINSPNIGNNFNMLTQITIRSICANFAYCRDITRYKLLSPEFIEKMYISIQQIKKDLENLQIWWRMNDIQSAIVFVNQQVTLNQPITIKEYDNYVNLLSAMVAKQTLERYAARCNVSQCSNVNDTFRGPAPNASVPNINTCMANASLPNMRMPNHGRFQQSSTTPHLANSTIHQQLLGSSPNFPQVPRSRQPTPNICQSTPNIRQQYTYASPTIHSDMPNANQQQFLRNASHSIQGQYVPPVDSTNISNQQIFANISNVSSTSNPNMRSYGPVNQGNTNAPPTTKRQSRASSKSTTDSTATASATNAQQQKQMYSQTPQINLGIITGPPPMTNQNIPLGAHQHNVTISGFLIPRPDTPKTGTAMGNVKQQANGNLQVPRASLEGTQFLLQHNLPPYPGEIYIRKPQSAHCNTQEHLVNNIPNPNVQQKLQQKTQQKTQEVNDTSVRLIDLLTNTSQNVQQNVLNKGAEIPGSQNKNRTRNKAPSTNPQQDVHQGTSGACNVPQNTSGTVPKTPTSQGSNTFRQRMYKLQKDGIIPILPKPPVAVPQTNEATTINFNLSILTDIQKIVLRNQIQSYFLMLDQLQHSLNEKEIRSLHHERNILLCLYQCLRNYVNKMITELQTTQKHTEKDSQDNISQNTSVLQEDEVQILPSDKLTQTKTQSNQNNLACNRNLKQQSSKKSVDSNISRNTESTAVKNNLSIETQSRESLFTPESAITKEPLPDVTKLQEQNDNTLKEQFPKSSLLDAGKRPDTETSLPGRSKTPEENSNTEVSGKNSETEMQDNVKINESLKSLAKNPHDRRPELCSVIAQNPVSKLKYLAALTNKTDSRSEIAQSNANERFNKMETESETSNVVTNRGNGTISRASYNAEDRNKEVCNANNEISSENLQDGMRDDGKETTERRILNSTEIQSDPLNISCTSISTNISESISPIKKCGSTETSQVHTAREECAKTISEFCSNTQQEDPTNEENNNSVSEEMNCSSESDGKLYIDESVETSQEEQRHKVSSSEENNLDMPQDSFNTIRCESTEAISLSNLLKNIAETDLTGIRQNFVTKAQDGKKLKKDLPLKTQTQLQEMSLRFKVSEDTWNTAESTIRSIDTVKGPEDTEEKDNDQSSSEIEEVRFQKISFKRAIPEGASSTGETTMQSIDTIKGPKDTEEKDNQQLPSEIEELELQEMSFKCEVPEGASSTGETTKQSTDTIKGPKDTEEKDNEQSLSEIEEMEFQEKSFKCEVPEGARSTGETTMQSTDTIKGPEDIEEKDNEQSLSEIEEMEFQKMSFKCKVSEGAPSTGETIMQSTDTIKRPEDTEEKDNDQSPSEIQVQFQEMSFKCEVPEDAPSTEETTMQSADTIKGAEDTEEKDNQQSLSEIEEMEFQEMSFKCEVPEGASSTGETTKQSTNIIKGPKDTEEKDNQQSLSEIEEMDFQEMSFKCEVPEGASSTGETTKQSTNTIKGPKDTEEKDNQQSLSEIEEMDFQEMSVTCEVPEGASSTGETTKQSIDTIKGSEDIEDQNNEQSLLKVEEIEFEEMSIEFEILEDTSSTKETRMQSTDTIKGPEHTEEKNMQSLSKIEEMQEMSSKLVSEDASSTGESSMVQAIHLKLPEDTEEKKIEMDTHSGIKTINEQLKHVSEQKYYGKPHTSLYTSISKDDPADGNAKKEVPAKNNILNADDECISVISDDSEGAIIPNILSVRTISPSLFEKIDNIDTFHQNNLDSLHENDEKSLNVNDNLGSSDEIEDRPCLRCKRKSTVYCQACLQAPYCSKRCSHLHWNAEHYKQCKTDSIICIDVE